MHGNMFNWNSGAECGSAFIDRVKRGLRRLCRNPMPVGAFVKPQAFNHTVRVSAADALVDRGSIAAHCARAVLVAVFVFTDLENSVTRVKRRRHVFGFRQK